MTPSIADCLYTGLATDTGCFKYGSTTPYAHRVAAALMEAGAQMESINRVMFDCKSRARVELERLALESMRFYWQGRLAVMMITNDMLQSSQAEENDMEGLAPCRARSKGCGWVLPSDRSRTGISRSACAPAHMPTRRLSAPFSAAGGT